MIRHDFEYACCHKGSFGREARPQEVVLLLCARLDALASCLAREDQSNRQSFSLVLDCSVVARIDSDSDMGWSCRWRCRSIHAFQRNPDDDRLASYDWYRWGGAWVARVSTASTRKPYDRDRRGLGNGDLLELLAYCRLFGSGHQVSDFQIAECLKRHYIELRVRTVWDNDGIRVDTEKLYFQAARDVLAPVGIALTGKDYPGLLLVDGKGAWHLAKQRGMAPDEIEALRDRRNRLYSERLAEGPRPIPGMTTVLDALYGRYGMGLVTSSLRDHFDLIHRSTGLLSYFDFVLTADDLTRTKPDPEPYERPAHRSGASPERVVAIEDSERGLTSAMAAGIGCIMVPTDFTRTCAFAGARAVVTSVIDIPALL